VPNPIKTLLGADPAPLTRGRLGLVLDLQAAINRCIAEHNRDPKLFIWTKTAD
jgi:hypothetical protein